MANKLIYVVEDDPDIQQLVCRTLRDYGLAAEGFGSGSAVRRAMTRCRPDLVIVDLGLPDIDGMALVRDRLYVIDTNRLVILAWPGYALQESIDLETSVANDVAVTESGVAYVTDTAKGQVIQRDPDGTQSVLTGEARFAGANGIALDGERLLVGGERLWRVTLESGSVETIGPEWLADIDGIEVEADGTLQITPVGGTLMRYRDENTIEIFEGDGISSANHGYAPRLDLALIPTGFDNTVIAIDLGDAR